MLVCVMTCIGDWGGVGVRFVEVTVKEKMEVSTMYNKDRINIPKSTHKYR